MGCELLRVFGCEWWTTSLLNLFMNRVVSWMKGGGRVGDMYNALVELIVEVSVLTLVCVYLYLGCKDNMMNRRGSAAGIIALFL